MKKCSPEALDLLQSMFVVDPTKRVSASECLLHPWITGKAHGEKHLVQLSETQHIMIKRMELKAKKAAERKKKEEMKAKGEQ